MIDYKNKQFLEKEIEKKPQNQIQPYYQGIIPSNRISPSINPNQSFQPKNKTIRLFSANNSVQRNKKYESQEKLKIYINKQSKINNPFSQTLPQRPTSVRQNNKNFRYQQIKSVGGSGIVFSTDLNYPHITLNSTISQANNIPFRKRKIVYEEDNELAQEYEKLRKIWREVGVTDTYIDNFETVTNNENNNKEEILLHLRNEEQQMIKFKEEMLKVVSEIIKRENDIKNIKEINKRYLNVKTRINIIPKKNVKNNNYIKENNELDKEDNENDELENEKRKELEEEKRNIEEEIERCLNYIRLHGINVVAAIKKFNMRYEHLLNAGKIDLDYLKQKYGFDKNYLLKLKNDLDFLKDTDIGDLYHFSEKGKDPFLVSISNSEGGDNDEIKKNKYKILPISEEMGQQIKIYNHLLNEIEIFTMMKNNINNNLPNNYSHSYKYGGLLNGINKKYDDSYIFESRLKTVNNFSNINNISSKILKDNKNASKTFPSKIKMQNIKLEFNEKNSQNQNNQNEYEKLKKDLTGKYNTKIDNENSDDVNNNKQAKMPIIKSYKSNSMVEEESSQNQDDEIIKEVQDKVNKEVFHKLFEVESRVKKKVEEKFKKDQEKLEEEEKRLKKEKEKIEELKRIEEEKRLKEKEKWEKIEEERIKKEEEERKRYEEDEKIKKEENEKFRKNIEEKFLFEIEQRFKREEEDRRKREEERRRREDEERRRREDEEEKERQRQEAEEDEKRKRELEQKRRRDIERIKIIEEERVKIQEIQRVKKLEEDKLRQEEEERMKQLDNERNRRMQEERRKLEELKKRLEQDELKRIADEKKRLEEEQRRKK